MDPSHPAQSRTAELIVKLTAAAMDSDTDEHRAVKDCVAGIGIDVAPLHPRTSDPELAAYLVAKVELGAVDRVIEQLVACAGIEGAYAKPAGQPPEGSAYHV